MLFVVDLGLIGWLVMRAYKDGMNIFCRKIFLADGI